MRHALAIAFRYIFTKGRKRIVSFMGFISILGIAVGVACLITVIAVMNGFRGELEKRIIGQSPHIIIERQDGVRYGEYEKIVHDIDKLEGVKGAYPFIWGQGVISFRKRSHGVALRSVDLENVTDKAKLSRYICAGAIELEGNGIILGKELSMVLGAFIGDDIDIITAVSSRPKKFKVTGIFHSGMYEYDLNLAYINLGKASEIFSTGPVIGGIGVDLESAGKSAYIKEQIENIITYDFYIRTWMELNENLFSALKLEKLAMFIILTLIVIVAALNIISTLTIMVTDKRKDIGILKAIGATKATVMNIFALQGIMIGFFGVILGAISGLGIVLVLDKWRFSILPESVYYGIDYLPVRISILDSIAVAIAALIISFLASAYPAYQASRLEPVDALRYE
jgi:lipoprotein-releasing system permease protein